MQRWNRHIAHNGTPIGTAGLTSGAGSYADTLPDMATTLVTASITLNGVTHNDFIRATVDSLNPEITISSPNVAADSSMVIVSGVIDDTGVPLNLHLENGNRGFTGDTQPNTDGGGHVTVTVVVAGGSDGGALVTSWNGTALATTPLTVTPQTVTQNVTLPEGAIGVMSIAATIGSGAYTISIPTYIDTLIPPTPVEYDGVPLSPDGGCLPCVGDNDQGCLHGCLWGAPASGTWTHIANQRHADIDFAATIPPDAGYLWGSPITGAIETQFFLITDLQIGDQIATYVSPDGGPGIVYVDGGSAADIPYPDGGDGIDFPFATRWLCSHHNPACAVQWSNP